MNLIHIFYDSIKLNQAELNKKKPDLDD